MGAEDNRATVRRFDQELIGQGNLAIADEILTVDFVYYGPPSGIHGPEGFKGFVTMLRTAFPDLQYETRESIGDGVKAGRLATMKGTHMGELLGVPGSGSPIAVPRIDAFFFEGDRIKEIHAFLDHQSLKQVLQSGHA